MEKFATQHIMVLLITEKVLNEDKRNIGDFAIKFEDVFFSRTNGHFRFLSCRRYDFHLLKKFRQKFNSG